MADGLDGIRLQRFDTPPRVVLLTACGGGAGLRRGEVLGLRWKDIDFDQASLTVSQKLEETRAGLEFKEPKTKRSQRTVTLPAITVDALREHKIAQAEERMKLGLGRNDGGLVFLDLTVRRFGRVNCLRNLRD